MNWVGVVVIFTMSWWTLLFAVLPWGVRSRWESEDDGVAGAEAGAPTRPELVRKALITTALATVATAIICAVIVTGVFASKD